MLAVGVVVREATRVAPPHEFVAVLQKSPDSPAFAVSVNIDTREFTVRPVSAPAPPGKSYEFWIIDAKLGAPRSLGVIDAGQVTRANGARAPMTAPSSRTRPMPSPSSRPAARPTASHRARRCSWAS